MFKKLKVGPSSNIEQWEEEGEGKKQDSAAARPLLVADGGLCQDRSLFFSPIRLFLVSFVLLKKKKVSSYRAGGSSYEALT